jgi:hypothetical protein
MRTLSMMRQSSSQLCVTPSPPDLAITGFVAIEKKEIGDPVVRSSEGNAAFVNYGDASHQRDLRKLGFQCPQLWRREVLWRCPEMQDIWHERGGEPHNEIHIMRK